MHSAPRWKAFLAWIKTTEAWQIFFVRAFPPGEKYWRKRFANGMSLVFAPVFLFTGLDSLIVDATNPILELEQMDKRVGVLLEVHTPRRGLDSVDIRTADGRAIRYEGSFGAIDDELRRHVGQTVTVWGQRELSLYGARNNANQIEANGRLIRDYRDVRIHMESFDRWDHKFYGTLFVLGLLLPLRVWWKDRKPIVSKP